MPLLARRAVACVVATLAILAASAIAPVRAADYPTPV